MVHYCAVDYIISQLNIHHFFCLISENGYGPFKYLSFATWNVVKLCQQRTLSTDSFAGGNGFYFLVPAGSLDYLWFSRALPAVELAFPAPCSRRADSTAQNSFPQDLGGQNSSKSQRADFWKVLHVQCYGDFPDVSESLFSITRRRLQPWGEGLCIECSFNLSDNNSPYCIYSYILQDSFYLSVNLSLFPYSVTVNDSLY